MRNSFFGFIIFCALNPMNLFAQTVDLIGEVVADKDLENIHIINKSSNRFTTTNALGIFQISAKYQDTILVSSVQYKPRTIVVTYANIQNKALKVFLEEQVNVLDEVIVGKILTGDLASDIQNSDAERPIDFYDVGLPGYTGKRLRQNERRLADADGGTFVTLTTINVYKILNRISGRTKMLKERVFLENKSILINTINARLNDDFFSLYPIPEKFKIEFWQFCAESESFEERCKDKSDIEIFDYLIEKHSEFVQNLETRKE
jgi:hypothetical protein